MEMYKKQLCEKLTSSFSFMSSIAFSTNNDDWSGDSLRAFFDNFVFHMEVSPWQFRPAQMRSSPYFFANIPIAQKENLFPQPFPKNNGLSCSISSNHSRSHTIPKAILNFSRQSKFPWFVNSIIKNIFYCFSY